MCMDVGPTTRAWATHQWYLSAEQTQIFISLSEQPSTVILTWDGAQEHLLHPRYQLDWLTLLQVLCRQPERCWEFLSVLSMPCPEYSIPQHSFPPTSFSFLSTMSSLKFSEPRGCWRRVLPRARPLQAPCVSALLLPTVERSQLSRYLGVGFNGMLLHFYILTDTLLYFGRLMRFLFMSSK